MKKNLLTCSLILSMLMAQVAFATPSFSDVDETTVYSDSITWMAENGVIQGYQDGSFGPDQCVNRAELLKMLYLSSEKNVEAVNPADNNIFSDTSSPDAWYFPYVSQALADETVEGYEDGTFKPGQCVNRAEAIKMAILEFNNGAIPSYVEENMGFAIDSSKWYAEYLYPAIFNQLVGLEHVTLAGADVGDFHPGDSMSRKEVAEMLYRMKTVKDNMLDLYITSYTPSALNFYISPSSGASFLMPKGFEVVYDNYYYTGSYTNDYPTLQIVDAEENRTLINMKMASCEDPTMPCYELNENYTLKAEANSEIANSLLLTFREPNWETYVNNHINADYNLKFAYPTTWEIADEQEIIEDTEYPNQVLISLQLKEDPTVTMSINNPPREIGYCHEGCEIDESGIDKEIPGLTLVKAILVHYNTTSRSSALNQYHISEDQWNSAIEIWYSSSAGQTFDEYLPDFNFVLDSIELTAK